jgi:hypothetical protein
MGVMGGIQRCVAAAANRSNFVVNNTEMSEDNMNMNVGNNMNMANMNNAGNQSPMVMLVALVIWVVVFLMVSKWLWNNVLTKLVTVVKPADSVWQLLGLAILTSLLTGN